MLIKKVLLLLMLKFAFIGPLLQGPQHIIFSPLTPYGDLKFGIKFKSRLLTTVKIFELVLLKLLFLTENT